MPSRTPLGLALPLVLACAPSKPPTVTPVRGEPNEPSSTPHAVPAPVDGCETHRAALREQYCDPEASDEPCEADAFVCELGCDLDGDGTPERVAIELVDGEISLGVSWADGRHELVASAAHPLVERESGTAIEGFSWLVSWKVLRRSDGAFLEDIGGMARKLPIGASDGDALLVSGGDAAAALVRRNGVFVLQHLGF